MNERRTGDLKGLLQVLLDRERSVKGSPPQCSNLGLSSRSCKAAVLIAENAPEDEDGERGATGATFSFSFCF